MKCSGPASQLGNTRTDRGTSTVGPDDAYATTASVATSSTDSAIQPPRRPTAIGGVVSHRGRASANRGSSVVASVVIACADGAAATIRGSGPSGCSRIRQT